MLTKTTESTHLNLGFLCCYTDLVLWKTGSKKPAAHIAWRSYHSSFAYWLIFIYIHKIHTYFYIHLLYTYTYILKHHHWALRQQTQKDIKTYLWQQCLKTVNPSSGVELGTQELMSMDKYWSMNLVNNKHIQQICRGRNSITDINCNQGCDKSYLTRE